MIPVVDQLMDCRDVCANAMLLSDDNEANVTGGWIALTLTGIGFIPVLGSAVKGVGKVIVKNPKESISLAAATLRKLGKGDPIAYIKNIDWQDLGKQGADLIKEKISAIIEALTAITSSRAVRWVVESDTLDSLRKQVKQLNELLPKVDAGIKNAIAIIEGKVKQAIKSYEGELPHVGKTGDVKKTKADELEAPKGGELPGAKSKPIPMKQHKPPCFTPGADLAKNFKGGKQALEKEFYKQLKAQQAGINKMSVGQYLNNRNLLQELTDKHGHTKARQILTKGGAAQTGARKKLEAKMKRSIMKSLKNKGVSAREAEKVALSKIKEQMSQLAALHDPDLIAGGSDKISRLGNKNVNSSLGSQWSKSGRVSSMDDAAEQALKTMGPNAQMNIKLERCK